MIVVDTNLIVYLLVDGDKTAMVRALWNSAIEMFADQEVEPDGDDVLYTAAELRISAYDAQFVVAARDLGVPLVTTDRKLREACRGLAVAPEEFTR